MGASSRLPDVQRIGPTAPLRWLAWGWGALWRSWQVSLPFGLVVAAVCAAIAGALIASNLAVWALTLTFGFVFVAPVLAMGNYETGRRLDAREQPTLRTTFLPPGTPRQDLAYLGLMLFVIFGIWVQAAQIVYGLSTYQIHRTVESFVRFALETPEGHRMLVTGTLVGGVMAFLTYGIVVLTAPMLLNPRHGFFEAVATSVRAVHDNFVPMLIWAAIIAALTLGSAATGFVALIVVFPWLGLASWRAYRDLVVAEA